MTDNKFEDNMENVAQEPAEPVVEEEITQEPAEPVVEEEITQELAEPVVEEEITQEPAEPVVEEEITQEPAESVGEAVTQEPAKKSGEGKIMLIVALAIIVLAVAFGGIMVVKNLTAKTDTSASVTLEDGSPVPDSAEGIKQGHSETAEVVTGEAATKGAEIKDSEAIEKITALSDEQLGLKKADYSFMIAQQAYIIDGEKYVQVIAAEKKENKDGTFSITPHGKYYISFDGEKVLKENMEKPGTYEEIKTK